MQLVQNVEQHLHLYQVQLLCRLTECLTTTIVLQKKGIDIEDEPAALGNEKEPDENLSTSFQLTDIPKEMLSYLKTHIKLVDDFIDIRLQRRSLEFCYVTDREKELQVSKCQY